MTGDNSIQIGLRDGADGSAGGAAYTEPIVVAHGSFGYSPPSEIVARSDEVEIFIELPGVAQGDISILASARAIIVSGQKRAGAIGSECDLYQCDRYFGLFEKRFDLPFVVQPDNISAFIQLGVLRIVARKAMRRVLRRSQNLVIFNHSP